MIASISSFAVFIAGSITNQEIFELSIKTVVVFLSVLVVSWILIKILTMSFNNDFFESDKKNSLKIEANKGKNIDLTVNDDVSDKRSLNKLDELDNEKVELGINKLLDMPGVGGNPLPEELPEEELTPLNLLTVDKEDRIINKETEE